LLREFSQSTRASVFRRWLPVAFAWATTAEAQPAPDFFVKLRYEREDPRLGCWEEQEFRQVVARAVGYDPFREGAPLAVEVQVSGSASLIDGRVEWKSAKGASMGERRFLAKDGDCAKLLTEMGFAVGLQIDLLRPAPSSADAASGDAPTTSPAPAPSSATTPHQSPTPTEVASNRLRMWLGAGPALSWGAAPAFAGQGRVFFGARRADLAFELGFVGSLPVVDRQPDGSGFRLHTLSLGGALCEHRGMFSACLLGRAGTLRVAGLDVDQPRSPSAFLAHTGARLAASWALSDSWFLQSQIEALGLLTPRTVTLQHAQVWNMPTLSLSAGIDLAARFR
jgi:hypothetical protein